MQNPWTSFDPEGLETWGEFGKSLIPDPRPSINQAAEGYSEAFSSEATIGQRAFGLTEGLAFDLDAAVTLIPGEGAAEHAVEKAIVTEVKHEVEAGVKQEVKTTVENDSKKEAEKAVANTGTTEQKVTKPGAKTGDAAAKPDHANKIDERPATRYKKYDKDDNFQKHGVTKHEDPTKRYSKKEIDGGTVVPVDRGPRSKMVKDEREQVETNPGPQNREPWAGKRKQQ